MDPPGAPGSTDSVRLPGTPITGPTTINQPGRYYLTRNITISGSGTAITIATDNVTLDLQGFTLSGTNRSGNFGVAVESGGTKRNITIRNGSIVLFQFGVSAISGEALVVDDITFDRNVRAIEIGVKAVVSNCRITNSLETGIYIPGGRSMVRNCWIAGNGGPGVTMSSGQNELKDSVVIDNNTTSNAAWADVLVTNGFWNTIRDNTIQTLRIEAGPELTADMDNRCLIGPFVDLDDNTIWNSTGHGNVGC